MITFPKIFSYLAPRKDTGAREADPCLALAENLVNALGLKQNTHVLFKENIATYLAQLDQGFVDSLKGVKRGRLVRELTRAYGHGPKRWGKKLEADIKKPYADEEVLAHLRRCETDAKERVAEIISAKWKAHCKLMKLSPEPEERTAEMTAANGKGFPFQLYVSGSLVRGRFGGNSDLDIIVADIENPYRGMETRMHGKAHFVYITAANEERPRRCLDAFGEKISLNPEEFLDKPGLLERTYKNALEKKGYALDFDPAGSMRVWKTQKHVVREKEEESIGIINWSFSDLPP